MDQDGGYNLTEQVSVQTILRLTSRQHILDPHGLVVLRTEGVESCGGQGKGFLFCGSLIVFKVIMRFRGFLHCLGYIVSFRRDWRRGLDYLRPFMYCSKNGHYRGQNVWGGCVRCDGGTGGTVPACPAESVGAECQRTAADGASGQLAHRLYCLVGIKRRARYRFRGDCPMAFLLGQDGWVAALAGVDAVGEDPCHHIFVPGFVWRTISNRLGI